MIPLWSIQLSHHSILHHLPACQVVTGDITLTDGNWAAVPHDIKRPAGGHSASSPQLEAPTPVHNLILKVPHFSIATYSCLPTLINTYTDSDMSLARPVSPTLVSAPQHTERPSIKLKISGGRSDSNIDNSVIADDLAALQ